MLRRTLLSLPLATVALSGCTRAHRQDEVFACYLRPILVEARDRSNKNGGTQRRIRLAIASEVSVASTFFGSEDLAAQIREVPAVQPSAVADLVLHKDAATRVRLPASSMPPAVTVDYLSPQDMRDIFGGERPLWAAWDKFYRTYPGAGGLLTFSPVGFSLDGRQAVFAFGLSCGGLCGSGHVVLMRRTWDGWATEDSQQLWIS